MNASIERGDIVCTNEFARKKYNLPSIFITNYADARDVRISGNVYDKVFILSRGRLAGYWQNMGNWWRFRED